ncbi:hypothetical protein [uncultured Nostoc sp.]|uniref:hypothetical protein n=1 Tax=uncultured Nostoc sp. TaxID=340711 RepID=UPI0035CC223D
MAKINRKKAVAQAISTAVALGWVIMQVELAQAATLTVNNLNDSGVGSLRDTINITNNNDVVEFLLGSHPSTISLTSGALAIAKNLTINGPGANLLTISGNNHFPVFDINAADVTFSGLAIAGDINANDSSNLTFTNSTISGDNVNIDSNLRLINSTISGNNVKIDNVTGDLTLINSTISSNNNIEINANDVTLNDDSHLVSSNNTDITTRRLNVQNSSSITNHSHLASSNNTDINATQVNFQDYSNIGTTNGITNGGTLTISTDNLGLNNDGQINAGSNNLGAGGDITITTSSLSIIDGATVNVSSRSISDGLGGNISLNVDDLLLLRRPVPEPSAIAGSILACSLAWLTKRNLAAFRKAKL